MKKFLLILLIIILIPVVGLIIFLNFANFNNYKPQIEELALKYANMKVKINGDLKIGMSLKPSIELNDVSIAKAENDQKIAQIGEASVKFPIIPLLKNEIVVDVIQTSNTTVFYSEKDSVLINDFKLKMSGYDSPINVTFDTVASGIQIDGDGSLSSFKYIKDSGYNDTDVKMNVKAMGYNVDFDGKVNGIQTGLTANGQYNIDYKSNKINGVVSADLTKNTPYLKLGVGSEKINLADFSQTKQASNNWLISEAKASTLMANTPIPYDLFSSANADVSVDIKKIEVSPDMILSNILANITLQNSVFKTDIINISAGDGTIKGVVSVNANSKTANANLSGNGIVLQKLNTAFSNSGNKELYIKDGGDTKFEIKLNTSGVDTNQYIANLNGQVIGIINESVMNIKSLERLQGNILVQILNNLKLNVTSKDLKVACAVVRTDIKNGVAEFPKGIVFNATDLYLVADGDVNLNNEKIDLSLQPFSGKITDTNISSVLGSLFTIRGTISSPSLGINKTQTVKNVVGVVATGGVLNAGDMLLSADSSPCYTALQGTQYSDMFTQSKNVINNTYTGTKDVLKNIEGQAKDVLKGLFGGSKK